jgi:hypothetical protein
MILLTYVDRGEDEDSLELHAQVFVCDPESWWSVV